MSFTFDTTTNIGKVRSLIQDVDATNFILSDEEINVYLSLEGNELYATAATALRALASSKAQSEKLIAAGDYKEDNRNASQRLLDLAKSYEAKAMSVPADAQAEIIVNDINWREIERNKSLRGDLD